MMTIPPSTRAPYEIDPFEIVSKHTKNNLNSEQDRTITIFEHITRHA